MMMKNQYVKISRGADKYLRETKSLMNLTERG